MGVHTIALTVDDGFGGTSTATVVVAVRDGTAPLGTLIASLSAQEPASGSVDKNEEAWR